MLKYLGVVAIVAGVLVTSQTETQAQAACPASPAIGYQCTQDIPIRA
jgi:hypothetical protein